MTAKIAIPTEVLHALQQQPRKGVAVEDESTHTQYVILPLDTYRQFESFVYDANEPDPTEFMPLAHEAFAEDWNAPGMEVYDTYDEHHRAS
jgi:hypothetical protein